MRKHKRIWMASTAALLTVVILTVTLVLNSTQALAAKPTFSGINQIMEDNAEENAFRILEVVPDFNMGTIGYYIGGEEPMHDALARLQSGSDRYHYVENLQTVLQNRGIMGDAGSTDKPLEKADYEELYQGSVSNDVLQQMVTDGKYREFVRDETISENQISANKIVGCTISANCVSVNSIYNYKMTVSVNGAEPVSGNFIPYYEPTVSDNTVSENDAYRFFKGENQCFSVSQNQAGIFDPYFVSEGEGLKFQATFEATKGRTGYVPLAERSEITVGAVWEDSFIEGTPVYRVANDVYECAGTLKNNGGVVEIVADDAHSVGMITSLNGESISIIEEPGNEPTGLYQKMKMVETKDVVEEQLTESDAEEIVVTEVTDLDGEELVGEAVGNGYYLVQFVYSAVNSDETHYQVSHLEEKENGPYILSKETPLVANGTGTGLILPNFDELSIMDIVYRYVEENGIYTMVHEDGAETAVRDCKIYYRGGIKNHEWFKQYVFDREYVEGVLEPVYLEVETITAKELQTYDLSQADMLYVTNAKGEFVPETPGITYDFDTYGGENDITRRRIIETLSSVINEKFPVMVDRSLILETDSTVISDFAKVMDQPSLEVFFNQYGSYSDEQLEQLVIPTAYFEANDHHHVNENVYVFNANSYTGNLSLTSGFISDFSANDIRNGFEEISKEIEIENAFIEEENKNGVHKDKLPTNINEAVAIKYILSMISKRGVLGKTDINVLEIEPINYHSSDLEVVETYIKDEQNSLQLKAYNLEIKGKKVIEESTKRIKVTTMSTAEYIGKTEDINSKYDLVYIGLNIGSGGNDGKGVRMNRYTSGGKEGRTWYNDTNMNGLVYTNAGDKIYCYGWMGGFLGNSGEDKWYRYSGNDITEEKVDALKEYVKAGYPVIFAQNFFTNKNNTVNVYTKISSDGDKCTGYIDNSSYMYQFAKWAINYIKDEKNVMQFRTSVANCVDRELLEQYIELAKPSLDCYDTSGVTTDADGNKYLNYHFEIFNKGTITKSSAFKCNLYLDTNADGKFSETKEKVSDFTIKDSSGNVVNQSSLRPGVTYHLSKLISNEYSGVITWKLEATQTSKEDRRDSSTGYFVVQGSEKIKINALQIMTSSESTSKGDLRKSTWNMEEALNKSDSLLRKYAKTDPSVANYDISVKSITADEYVTAFRNKTIDLTSYDMLIMGFADCYVLSEKSENQDVLNSIADYIKSGRSVLFTHDTTSYRNDWGAMFNATIRELVGLDRYGVTGDTSGNKDKLYQPNTNRGSTLENKQGYVNQILCKQKNGRDQLNNLDYRNLSLDFSDTEGGGSQGKNMRSAISQVNAGQVTDYPYKITTEDSPVLDRIAKTHSQYYQLDLLGDFDHDEENDVVVWYCIQDCTDTTNYADSDTVYKYSPNDVRNNYYIYNRSNVTYSGAGHSDMEVPGNDKEVQLFVNTLVASYSTGVKAPTVSIIENPANRASMTDNVYAPFDYGLESGVPTANGNYVDTAETAYFYAADTNIIKYSAELSAKVYYENSASSQTIQVGADTVHVSELDLNAYPIVDPVTKLPLTATGTTGGVADVNSRRVVDKAVYQLTLPVAILGNTNCKEIYVAVSDDIKLTESAEVKTLTSNDHVSYTRVQLFNLD